MTFFKYNDNLERQIQGAKGSDTRYKFHFEPISAQIQLAVSNTIDCPDPSSHVTDTHLILVRNLHPLRRGEVD